MFLGPIGDVLQSAMPILDGEVVVIKPRVSVCVVAAPLCLSNVHIRVDVHASLQRCFSNVIPDLEATGVLRPALVLCHHLFCDLGAVLVAQGGDHRNLERNIATVALVDLVHHLNGVSKANKVEANTLDQVKDVLHRTPFHTFRDHRLARTRPIDTSPLHSFPARIDDISPLRRKRSIGPTAIGNRLSRNQTIRRVKHRNNMTSNILDSGTSQQRRPQETHREDSTQLRAPPSGGKAPNKYFLAAHCTAARCA